MKAFLVLLILTTPLSALANKKVHSLIEQCLPSSHWEIMKLITQKESSKHIYAIGVNKKGYKSLFPKTKQEAEGYLDTLLAENLSVDIGLTQINTQHFKKGRIFAKKGFSPEDALEPCTNLKMGATIFSDAYRRADGDIAVALSIYNTGHPRKGFKNGYVQRYLK